MDGLAKPPFPPPNYLEYTHRPGAHLKIGWNPPFEKWIPGQVRDDE